MKLTFPSAFRKTKKSSPAESQDALPQYSIGFRAMALLTASLVFLQGPMAIAATNTWTGKGDGVSFLDSDNWSTFDVVSSDTIKFLPRGSSVAGIGSLTALAVNLQGSATVFGIAVGDARTAAASSITIAGGTLTLGSNGSDGIGFTDVGGFARTLVLGSTLTLKVAAPQNINVNLADDSVILSGNISSVSGIASTRFSKTGLGSLVLSGDNSGFTGGISLGVGVLSLNSATALGSGSLEILGGNIDNTSAASVALTTNNVQSWSGDFTYIGSQGRLLNMGTGAVTLAANRNVTVSAGEFAVGGIIGGTYSLNKAGAGALTLSGANTFDGGLTLSAGQLNLNNAAAAGTGILTIKGGSIDNTSSSAVTLTAASQVWDSGFTFIGTRALNTGTGDITLSTGTVLTIQGSLFTVGGSLSGTASLTKAGAGRLQLEAAATYTGSTTVTGGTLSTNAANLLPNSTDVNIEAGAAIELGGAQVIESLRGAGNLATVGLLTLSNGSSNSFSGVLSGTGSLTLVTGAGTLSGANTYSGNTELQSGAILKLGNSAALGSAAGSTNILEGATLDLNGQTGVQEALTVSGTGSANMGALVNTSASPASLTGLVTLAGDSSIGGSGNLTLSGGLTEDVQRNLTKVGVGTLTLDGPSTFTGTATVAEGVLKLANNNALGNGTSNASGVSVTSGASLDLNGTEPVSVPLTINGAGVSGLGALANSAVAPATYAGDVTLGGTTSIGGGIKLTGSIIGAEALTKVGAGLLVLEGAANAAASVAVNAGTVQVGNGSTLGTLGTANVSVAEGALLAFKRSDDYTAAVTNVISGSGNVTVASGTLTLGGANTYTGITRLLNGSTLILGGNGALGASSKASVETGALLDLNGNASSVNLELDGRSASVAALTNSGALVQYGGLVSLATGTVSAIGGSGDIILSRAVSGGTLSKVGANTLTLGSLNSFGRTSVNSGTLKLTDTGSFGTEDIQVANGAQIIFARTDASVVDNSISGEGTVSIEAGTLTLTGTNAYTGATTVLTGATLSIGNGGTTGSITSDIDIRTNSSLKFNRNSDSTYAGVLSGNGAFTKLGTGTLSLSGASDLSNATIVVEQGRLSIGTGGATGELQGNITVANNAALQFNRTGLLTYGQVISGSGSVSNIASGTITLEGTQTYFGSTNVSSGTLLAETLLNTSAVNVSNGRLTVGSFSALAPLSISGNGVVTVTGTGLSVGQVNNASAATTGLSFTEASDTITVAGLSGLGATTFANDATIGGTIFQGSVTVAGSLTTTGTINGGAIVASGNATMARVSAGNLTLGGAFNTITELFGGTLNFTDAAAALEVAGGIQEASGVISGSANLTSAGNLTLNGANTYTRGTALTGGTLSVGGISALGSGELVVTSGASLAASTAGASIANQISLGGTLNFRGSNALTAQGSLVLSAESTLNVAAQTLTLGGTIDAGGFALTKEGVGTLSLTGTNSAVALTINAGTVNAGTSALSTSATVTTASPGAFSLLGNQSIDSVNGSGNLLLGSSSLTLANGGTYSGVISGSQSSFLNLTAGSLIISGNSPEFDGTLAVNGGAVDLNQTIQRVGSAILNGGTIQNGTLNFSRLTLSSGDYNAQLRGGGELKKDSTAATVSLGADNSLYTGNVVVEGGVLSLEHAKALTGAVAVSFTATNGNATLSVGTQNVSLRSLSGGMLAAGSQGIVALGNNTLTLETTDTQIFSGSITSNAGTLVISGAGKQVLAGDSTGAVLSTNVQSGVLELRHELALGNSANQITLSGGELSINTLGVLAARHDLISTGTSSLMLGGSQNQTLGDLSVAGTLSVTGGIAGAVQNIAFEDTTLASAANISVGSYASVSFGTLTGNNDLTKSGNGSLTLTAANSGTAATTVTGGSLIVGASGRLASGSLTINGAGIVLDLGTTSQTVGAVSVTSGTVQQGTLQGASFSLNDATISTKLIGSGALTSSGATSLSGQNTYTGGTTVNGGLLTVTETGSLNTTSNLVVSQGAQASFLSTNVTIGSISGAGTTSFSGTANITAALNEGVVGIGGDANLTGGVTGGAVTVGGAANTALSGVGALNLNGSGSTLTAMTGGTLTLAANRFATVATFTNGDASVAGTLRVSAGTFGGTLRGPGSLDVLNGNNVTLNGTLGNFEGTYTVNASTLSIGSATSDRASLALVSGGTANLNFNGGSLRAVTNDGRLVLTNGTITLGGLTGNGVVSSGGSTSLKVGNSGVLSVFAGSLTGGITLTKEGNGRLDLAGSSDFTGTANVSSGILSIGTGGTSGALTAAINVASGAEVRFDRSDALAYGAVISGQGAVVKSGTGTTTLSAVNTYTGLTTVNQGTLVISGGLAQLNNLDVVTSARADLSYTGPSLGTVSNSGVVNFGSLTGTANVTNLSGNGTTGFAGTLTVGNYTGSGAIARIYGGTGSLSFGTVNATGVTTLSGDASITQLLGGAINLLSPGVLSVSSGASAGVISGSASLVKVGSGSLTLSGVNTYTGLTTVQGGLLSITGSLRDGANLTISSGTAEFANAAVLGAVSNNGLLRFGSTGTMTSLTGAGSTEFAGGVTLGDVTGGNLTIATRNTGAVNNVGALSGVTLTITPQTTVTAASFAGTTATVDGILNITGAMSAGQVANNGVVTVGNLTGGSFVTAQGSVLNIATGVFGGTISGVGSVNTTAALRIEQGATLSDTLLHSVSAAGSLTFAGNRSVGTLQNEGSVKFVGNGAVQSLDGLGSTEFQSGATLGTVSNGIISVVGNTVFTNFNGGELTTGGLVTGTFVAGGVLNLNGSGNRLQSVLGGDVNVGGSTEISLLRSQNGLVLVSELGSLSISTLERGQIDNRGALSVSQGVFDGVLSGDGSLEVTQGLELRGIQTNFTGAIGVRSGGNLTLESGISSQNNVTVDSAAGALFKANAGPVTLLGLANSGTVTFESAANIANLTGSGSTLFSGNATLRGGISSGTVTLDGSLNEIARINGTAQVNTRGVTIVDELIRGTVTNTGRLDVRGGTFDGSLLGNGTVNTTGVFNIAPTANLGTSLRYTVEPLGALTFQGVANIGTLESHGSTTFGDGGSLSTQTGVGSVNVTASTLTVERGLGGMLTVGSGAAAIYTQSATLSDVDNRGSLTLPSGSTVTTINSVGTLNSAGLLTVSNGQINALGGVSASLTKVGAGSLVLSGASSYTGNTTITGGVLSLATGATLPSGNTLTIGTGATLELSGNSLNLGRLELDSGSIIGSGTLTLRAADYASAGNFRIGNAITLDLTYPQTSAGFTLKSGTFSSVSGVSTIGGSSSTVVTVASGEKVFYKNAVNVLGALKVAENGQLTVNGSLRSSSTAPVTLAKGSSLIISGNSNVNVSELAFGDSLADAGGTLQVEAPTVFTGQLSGSGTLRGGNGSRLTFGSGAVFDIGYSTGRVDVDNLIVELPTSVRLNFEYLTESANSAATSSSTLDYVASGAVNSDRLVLNSGGTLDLGSPSVISVSKFTNSGTVRLTNNDAHYFPLVVLNGGTLKAGTASITAANLNTLFTMSPDNSVVVVGTPVLAAGGSVNMLVQRRTFASFGGGNVAATGALLDRALALTSGTVSALIDHLDSRNVASAVTSTLAALDPGVYADLGNVGLDRLRDIQSGLANHIDMLALDTVGESTLSLAVKPGQSTAAAAIEQSRAWTTGYGGWGKRNADSAIGSAGYSSSHFGDISGVETKVGGLTLGLLGAVGSSTATFENGRGSLSSDSWHAGIYGNLPAGAFVLDASFAYGQSEGTLKRSVNVAGGGATTGKTQGTEWTGQVGVAVPFRTESGSLVITPSVHLIHANVTQDGLTESSLNGLEAIVKDSTTKSTAVRTGVQAAKITKLANKTTRLTASLDWVHSFDSGTSDVEIALQGAGATTSRFQGSRSSKDAVRIGLGAEIALTERTRFRLNVDEQIRSGMQSTFGSASLGFQF
jgi:fibronectin-binding autotransporter adhesin